MKKVWALIFCLIFAAGCLLWFSRSKPDNLKALRIPANDTFGLTNAIASEHQLATNGKQQASSSAVTQEIQSVTAIRSISPATPTPESPAMPPLTVLDNARVVIHNYHDRFGENPVGNNAEITAALLGQNPKQVKFISEDSGLRVNDQGELLDGYGTPFFFHQISSKQMEIRSAGIDHKLWTLDDEVTR